MTTLQPTPKAPSPSAGVSSEGPTLKQRVFDLIISPCLVEGGPYAERSRKIAVTCLSVMASNAMMVGIPLTIIAAVYDPDPGLFITGITCILCSLTTSFIPYLYLRRTQSMPQWMVDFQLWSTVPSLLSFMLFMHQGPVTIVCSAVALVAILLRVRLWYLYLAIIVLGNAFNHIVAGFREELPGLHSAMVREQYLFERIALLMGAAALPLTVLGLALHGLITDFVQRADQADAAIAMFLSVSKKLAVYNTDGVAEILAANKGKVDENLLEAFAAIQHNLQEYRPHIPDYVIAATSEKLGGNQQDGEGSLANSSVIFNSGVEEFSEGSFSDAPKRKGSSVSTVDSRIGGKAASSKGGSVATTQESRLSNSNRKVTDRSEGDSLTAHFYGRATTVFVRFVGAALESSMNTVSDRQCVTFNLNACMEVASKLAKANGGALQYMQGCGLMVSFNAASRVMSHERGACMFALALQEDIEAVCNGVFVHASIVTTPVMSFFAGNKGQLMLTVLGGFMPQHTAIHEYGRMLLGNEPLSASMLLMSATTMNGLGVCVTMRPVGEVVYSFESSHQTVLLYQAISVIRKASTTEEWMYDLRDEGNETTEVDAAMKLALSHEYQAALDTIKSAPSQDAVITTITRRLEECVASGAPFPATITTPRMW
jgi:hypothetical protein